MNHLYSRQPIILKVFLSLFFCFLIELPAIGSAEPTIRDRITSQFEAVHLFSDSLATQRIGNHYGFIDKQ
jgi:hypothetical protein